jgi:hypothetical protein
MSKIIPLFLVFIFFTFPSQTLAQAESPTIVAKWRKFVQSLSSSQRAEFDRLHLEAGKMDGTELARKVDKFKAGLDSQQRANFGKFIKRNLYIFIEGL